MRFFLYAGETEIGEARLHGSDPPMGCALFHLSPNDDYSAVQPLQSESMERFDRNSSPQTEKDVAALDLTIRDEDGAVLTALGVDVTDYQSEMPDEPTEIWLVGMDSELFEHYFPGEYGRYEQSFQ